MEQNNGTTEHPKEVLDQTNPSNEVTGVPNGNHAEGEGDQNAGEAPGLFQITVKLPHEPYKIQVMVSNQEQVQDVRQSIVELPGTFQYTSFHLEHNGERINDYVELSEVKDLKPDAEIVLVEDPYTEKEARMHLVRIRELIGASGDRVDNLHGICAGLSLHDSVAAGEQLSDDIPSKEENSANGTAEHALVGYEVPGPADLRTILPRKQAPFPKTVKSISLSPWNPPPYHLRQKGHLLYLQVTTNEGEQYQITSHVSGFFVNKCSNSKFDPFPRAAPKNYSAHSLLTLISLISPSFENSFKALQEANNKKDLLTTFPFQNSIPHNPWLVPPTSSPATAHQSDITRPQENYLIAGVDNSETLRDWNEEFQTTRELPRDTVQDKVFRERLTSKLFADYNDAAARGAVLVARGEVAPLNPTEGRDAQIFVYNNIFFSFGADGVGTFASEGGDEAARVAVAKDVMGVKAVNQLDIAGLFTPGTMVIDYLGKRVVGQSIVPGIFKQREPGEHQIDYGGVDGKDVIAKHEAFVPVFEKLSKALRVKKHPVWDKDGARHELESSVETKGLLGTDGRKYLAALAKEKGARLQALTALMTQDMVARAFKHIANRYLRNLPSAFATSCIAHLLNCLLGTEVNSKPRAEIDESLREIYPEGDFSFEQVTPTALKEDIEKQIKIRYRFSLDADWTSSLRHLQLLRDISLKLGLQLGAKNYAFDRSQLKNQDHSPAANGTRTPEEGGKKKKKKGSDQASPRPAQSPAPAVTFVPDDILNIVPIVKDASPRSALSEEALEAGRISLMQNQKELGQELILESLSLHEQIYGILHPEVAKLYHQLSMLYYQSDDKDAAVELARKAVIVTERTMGVDSADAILSYLNLSLFEHATGNTKVALVYIRHALELWKIIYGPNHPDSITTMNNAAVMLQHLKLYPDSRKWFEASLTVCEELFGRQSVNTATILFQLAQALALDQDSKAAVNRMRDAYNIFLNELGPEDRNTKEAESWLEQLTQNAVYIAKHAKDIQARRRRLANLPTRLGTKPQPQVGQTTSEMANAAEARGNASLDPRSIDELLKFIEGGESSAPRTKQKKRAAARNPKLRGSKQSTVKPSS
ncbi:hypothetical protein CISG_02131 [Coccidioides immitis RMSCC 3703]|uniref:Clu domain-containing protein n=1 Tax=Coccidioides immitis RMSCC 3703 TaxID=454286 RepID=A0A0J8R7J2_COCIT|nr:hypothetical protein CISG_02131 [Coccidioides immitis RMSCC 3703]